MAKQAVNQIYTIVNALLGQSEGGNLAVFDSGSLVATGEAVLSSQDLGNAFFENLTNMVGKTQVSSRIYRSDLERLLMVDDMEYGNILRKIHFPLNQMEADQSYNLQEGQSIDMYKVHIVKPVERWFTKQTPYAQHWSTRRGDVKKAFTSAADMGAFLSAYRNVFANSMAVSMENLARACIINFICAASSAADTRTVKLVTLYKQYVPDFDKEGIAAMLDESFMSFCVAIIKDYMDLLRGFNKGLYNDGSVDKFTPLEDQRLILNTKFLRFMETSVKYKAFNEKYLDLSVFGSLPFWQTPTEPLSVSGNPTSSSDVTVKNVVGVLSDREAFGIYRHDYRIYTTPINTSGEYWNTDEKCENLYFNDFAENFIFFTLD